METKFNAAIYIVYQKLASRSNLLLRHGEQRPPISGSVFFQFESTDTNLTIPQLIMVRKTFGSLFLVPERNQYLFAFHGSMELAVLMMVPIHIILDYNQNETAMPFLNFLHSCIHQWALWPPNSISQSFVESVLPLL